MRAHAFVFGAVAAHSVFSAYVDAVVVSGGLPVLLPCLPAHVDELLDAVDAIVLTGGLDLGVDPERDTFETLVASSALDRRIPLLAACRGLQVVNVARGGTLLPHVDGHLGVDVRHAVDVEPGSELARTLGLTRIETGSLHHQAVDQLGNGLNVTARAADGTVEAVEAPGMLAVQWHPELETGHAGAPLFAWLTNAAQVTACN